MSMDNPRTHAERDAAMRADPHYHEGRPSVHVIGKGRKALVAVYCPAGHVYTSTRMQDWAGSWLEAKLGDKHWTVQCIGTLPEGWRGPIMGGAPTPADDPAGPGATREQAGDEMSPRVAEAILDFMVADLTLRGIIPTEHTHPCPTCHQARPCTGTGCADGPRECTTCSNCRGW
jgi:hypothetical protein